MIKILNKYANIRNTILLFVIVLLFNLIIFPISYRVSPKLTLLDVQIFYTPKKAYDILKKFSEIEKKNYLLAELTVDLIYPIAYSFLLCFIIFLVYKNESLAKFPFLILTFDYIENFGIATLIYNYPEKLIILAWITAISTSIKWLLVGISVIIILYGLGAKKHFFRKK